MTRRRLSTVALVTRPEWRERDFVDGGKRSLRPSRHDSSHVRKQILTSGTAIVQRSLSNVGLWLDDPASTSQRVSQLDAQCRFWRGEHAGECVPWKAHCHSPTVLVCHSQSNFDASSPIHRCLNCVFTGRNAQFHIAATRQPSHRHPVDDNPHATQNAGGIGTVDTQDSTHPGLILSARSLRTAARAAPSAVLTEPTRRRVHAAARGHSDGVEVAVLLIAIALLVVGLPFAAVAWSRASYLRRPSGTSWLDVLHTEARRQRLTASEIDQVTSAVNRGTVVAPKLRPLTVTAATAKTTWLQSALQPHRNRWIAIATVLLGVMALGAITAVASHRPGGAVMVVVESVLLLFVIQFGGRARLRRARRAVELNGAEVRISDSWLT